MLSRVKQYVKSFAHILQHRPITAVINIVEPQSILENKVALITGGTSGIGKSIAEIFHKAGATVIITSRDGVKAHNVASIIGDERRKVYGIGMDICEINDFQTVIDSILQSHGKIDILVNNAGIIGGDIRYSTPEEFDKVLSTNLKGAFFLSKMVATHMVKSKIHGNILNVASSSSLRPAISAYTLSKWGIRGLTEGLAKMLIPHDIVVNGIAPGPTATPLLNKSDYSDVSHKGLPNGRYAIPEEIAAMALFLVGPQGRTIIGDVVYMTGGAGIIENNDIDYSFNPQ